MGDATACSSTCGDKIIKPIAVTPGEPAGIGPDLIITLAQQGWDAPLVVIADPDLLMARAQQLGLPLVITPYIKGEALQALPPGHLAVLPIALATPAKAGQLAPANAPYVITTLQRATEGCLQREFAALVTGPIHKGVINDAGIPFTGHTEFLAAQSRVDKVVMMLATPTLRVALVTTHVPLKAVSTYITRPHLTRIIEILHQDLQQKYQLPSPRILIAGLNPHAGEGGHLGDEEITVITPVIKELQQRHNWQLTGPLPADTLFTPRYLKNADAILTMYHDQGLPVLKYAGFGQAVNITLGLPFIRTSVDHGTALELAGSGKAEGGSLHCALLEAMQLANAQVKTAAIPAGA